MAEDISPTAPPAQLERKLNLIERWQQKKREEREGMDYLTSLPQRFVIVYLPVLAMLFILLFPFYWMGLTSLKPDTELIDGRSIHGGSSTRRWHISNAYCLRPSTRLGCGTPCWWR